MKNKNRVVQVIWEEDISWHEGYCQEDNDRRWFAKPKCSPKVVLYLLSPEVRRLVGCYLKSRVLRTCNRLNRRICRLDGASKRQLYDAMFRKRNVTSWPTPHGCTGAVLPLLALFIPHAEWEVNESLFPDCATLRFGKCWVHSSEPLWFSYLNGRTILNFPLSHHRFLPLPNKDLSTDYNHFDAMTPVNKRIPI